jgi:hypothetical protein
MKNETLLFIIKLLQNNIVIINSTNTQLIVQQSKYQLIYMDGDNIFAVDTITLVVEDGNINGLMNIHGVSPSSAWAVSTDKLTDKFFLTYKRIEI